MGKNNWQIYKFGGSSLNDSDCINRVCNLIKGNSSENLIVVVSAMSGMTNQLLEYSQSKDESILQTISDRYIQTLNATLKDESFIENVINEFNQDLVSIRERARLDSEVTLNIEDNQILGYGEIWSSRLIKSVLNQVSSDLSDRDLHLINPLDVVTVYHTDMGTNIDWIESKKLFNKEFSGKQGIFIMGGFLARDSNSIATNLGRNGSDYSASIMGSLAEAKDVSIWTDTNGIMTADPNQIQSAKTIKKMSYDEAIELAYFGAEVIHEKTMLPLMNKGIPIYIRNTFNPESNGTEISSKANGQQLSLIHI